MQTVISLFKKASTERGYISVMVNCADTLETLTADGWEKNLEAALVEKIEEPMTEEERELRDEYERLAGKKAGGRMKLDTLKTKVEELKSNEA